LTSDSFAGLRALLLPARRRAVLAAAARRRPGIVPRLDSRQGMEGAGRWALLATASPGEAPAALEQVPAAWQRAEETAEAVARALLRRYGVLTRRLLDGEGPLPPWRDLLAVLRRLEARGEVRGGRFVDGVSGEQYALPEAVARLRAVRRSEATGALLSLSAVDPLCVFGLLPQAARPVARTSNRLLYRDGEAVAVLESGAPRLLVQLPPAATWEVETALRRGGGGARRERSQQSA
jgi:ATP-dependent helicase Lhr and Lhr-like helicase